MLTVWRFTVVKDTYILILIIHSLELTSLHSRPLDVVWNIEVKTNSEWKFNEWHERLIFFIPRNGASSCMPGTDKHHTLHFNFKWGKRCNHNWLLYRIEKCRCWFQKNVVPAGIYFQVAFGWTCNFVWDKWTHCSVVMSLPREKTDPDFLLNRFLETAGARKKNKTKLERTDSKVSFCKTSVSVFARVFAKHKTLVHY